MVTKVFLATYVNMAVVALVAYGYLRNKPDLAKTVHTPHTLPPSFTLP
jgi:hypothetical protein